MGWLEYEQTIDKRVSGEQRLIEDEDDTEVFELTRLVMSTVF